MLGNVKCKIEGRGYGFIVGEDKEEYFFHITSLKDIRWEDLTDGDCVTFEPELNKRNGKSIAKNIRKNYAVDGTTFSFLNSKVFPGMHPMININHFTKEEQMILHTLSRTFYVTNGGSNIQLGSTSEYRYCLIKPTDIFNIQFNLNREIIVIFSLYNHFEPRTFDAISAVYRKNKQQFRIDKICSVLVSMDSDITEEIKRILKSGIEMQVIIPFTYSELKEGNKTELIINRFREYFFERDLFAFESPLKKDIYFFGRREYVHELINRHKSGENSGVFGLRRSGKTSVLQAIMRAASLVETTCVFIDCQDLYHFRWNKALFFVIDKIATSVQLEDCIDEKNYTEEKCSISFSKDLEMLLGKIKDIILMIDEVEQITPNLSLNQWWKDEDDFIKFWHAIRSNFHKWGNRFTFILAGTNPSAVEMISVNKHDNPLFNQLKADSYLPPFDVEDTKDMVNKLGGYMGLTFDDIVCANLTKDFGGHPYLIRHFCSAINNYIIDKRLQKPAKITNALYEKVMPIFAEKSADNFCRFILDVLVNYYPEENRFLERLALGNVIGNEHKETDPQLLSHLMGYNIIENNQGVLGYKIEILKKYLIRKNAYKKQNMTIEEKWAEISERRNNLEPKLRIIIKTQLKSVYGEAQAKKQVINCMRNDLKEKYKNLSYADLFNPSKCEVYFSHLGHIVDREWDKCFKNIMTHNKLSIKSYFTIINDLRAECHAKDVTDEEMNSFRGAMSALEKEVENYFS